MVARSREAQTINREIFISLTRADSEIAGSIQTAIREILGIQIKVHYSSSEELGVGISHGEDWLRWIADRIRRCDFALLLVTPVSARKSWILWEAGAVYGIAMASGKGNLRKVRPIVYLVEDREIPSPIRDMRTQFRRGDKESDMKVFFKEMADQYRRYIPTEQMITLESRVDHCLQTYMQTVKAVLTRAPLLELIDRYFHISAIELRDRVRQKNQLSQDMASYIIANNIKRTELTVFKNVEDFKDGLILALASVSIAAPEQGDTELLLKVAKDVGRLHVKYRIMVAVAALVERFRLSNEVLSSLEELLKKFALGADGSLMNRINETRSTIEIYRR
jgi:TIR domain